MVKGQTIVQGVGVSEMLTIADLRDAAAVDEVGESVRRSDRLVRALRLWVAQTVSDSRRLAVYFEAVAIMLQVSGGAGYEYVEASDGLQDLRRYDRATVLNVLALALKRLDASKLMEQVPGGVEHERRKLSADLAGMIAARDHAGLLNVVAECLDYLIVRPRFSSAEGGPGAAASTTGIGDCRQ